MASDDTESGQKPAARRPRKRATKAAESTSEAPPTDAEDVPSKRTRAKAAPKATKKASRSAAPRKTAARKASTRTRAGDDAPPSEDDEAPRKRPGRRASPAPKEAAEAEAPKRKSARARKPAPEPAEIEFEEDVSALDIDDETLEALKLAIQMESGAEDALLAAAELEDDEDDEPEEEFEAETGPVFDGPVPLDTEQERTWAMDRAARRLGIHALHDEQREVIDAALRGEDVLMILPTGFGKSACFQIPSMILPKPVLVISPLLALMKDQHEKLQRLNVPVVKLDGTVRGGARKAALERVKSGERLLVMTTPETLASPDASAALKESGVSMAAVDEAHCISEWGYDFRPAYLQIGERLRSLGGPPVLSLTATATEKVRMAIERFTGMRDPKVVATSPHRDNLAFDVLHCSGGQRLRALVRLALRVRRPGIIYCSTTRDVDQIYAILKRFGVPAHRYHGKMSASERSKNQEAFMQRGRRTVMIATNAFGLGIDKSDIRYILHYQSPASLEQYVQEAGRAGRDDRRANCILLYSSEDRQIHEALLSRSRVRPEQLYRLTSALSHWAKEEKTPSLQALALSAELGTRTTAALLALMEEATLVKWDQEAVFVTVSPEQFEPRARELAGQFETLRTQDSQRLDAVADYAIDAPCRASFLQAYFGEGEHEPCGICDRCRGQADRPNSFWEPLTPPRGEERRRRGNRSSGGRGRKQGARSGAGSGAGSGGRSSSGGGSNGNRKRSRKSGQRRRRGRGRSRNEAERGETTATAAKSTEARAEGAAKTSSNANGAQDPERRNRRRRGRRRGGRGRRGRRGGTEGPQDPTPAPS